MVQIILEVTETVEKREQFVVLPTEFSQEQSQETFELYITYKQG